MGYFKSFQRCLSGQHTISIHLPNSKRWVRGGNTKRREARKNLEMLTPPARGCVRAHRQPASVNWTSSLALNLASWKSFFKYILFNLLKSRPACGRGGATRLCEARTHLGRQQTSWTAAPGFGCQPPRNSAQQVEVEGGLAFKATVPKLGGHAEVTATAASLEKAGN